jgi:hypothetical protein
MKQVPLDIPHYAEKATPGMCALVVEILTIINTGREDETRRNDCPNKGSSPHQ